MRQILVFRKTQFRLAAWYASVMGVILSICAIGIYQAIAQERISAIEQKMNILLVTLHDGVEPLLIQPGQLNEQVGQMIPGLCRVGDSCTRYTKVEPIHILGIAQQTEYYIRFLDSKQQMVAFVGTIPSAIPERSLLPMTDYSYGQKFYDGQTRQRHYQVSINLKMRSGENWGYLEIGRSLQEGEQYLQTLRERLIVGLPLAMGLVSLASWFLAGLSMRPVYQSYQKIQQFTADAAHELRTPLATIRSTIDATLREPIISEESRTSLKAIQRQSRRLTKLAQNLLLLSRFDLQQNVLECENCNLNDVVGDLVEEFSAFAMEVQVRLSAQLPPTPLMITADTEKLYQVMTNLIVNAIQHTPIGGQVTIILQPDSPKIVSIKIVDTGVGIAQELLPYLFDRFYRIDSDRSRTVGGGAGLGLAIVQAIVQAHHGKIQVYSQLQQGSQFTVLLPMANRPRIKEYKHRIKFWR